MKPTNEQIFNLFKTIKEETDNMNFTLTSGKIETAKKVVIYGPEGIGKSTLASKFPGTVFIDTEGSTKELDVVRYPTPTEWFNILDEIDDCIANTPCKTLVIDTADWAEQLCSREVCKRLKVSGIEDVGYGKGYTYLKEEFARLLKKCNDLVDRGVNVVFTAHAMMRKFEQPDEMGAYDRWEMKLSKQCSPLLKEWADIVLFCNYKTSVLTDANTKSKKATGGKRVMYASHHPCWDAKNRYGLPDEMDMSYEPIAKLFSNLPEPKKAVDPFISDLEKVGLTIEDVKKFSQIKGNYPGVEPIDYPDIYKDAIIKSAEKIKNTIKEN